MRRTHYVIGERPKTFWRKYLLWAGIFLIILALIGSWIILNRETEKFEPVVHVEASDTVPDSIDIETRVLFVGDTIWGRYIDVWSQRSPLKTAYPFSRLKELGTFDARIANLECPIVSGVRTSAAQQEATLLFNCPPEYVEEAAKLFDAFSLANNHTNNQGGQTGLEETRIHLDKGGIQYFGHFDPEILDDVCEIISLPVRITNNKDGGQEQGELPISMCGYHGLASVPSSASLRQMTEYSKYMPTFSYPHMGAEYVDGPDPVRTNLYRSMIDAGADAVFAGHPHWVQPTEVYKGRLIAYSMGNFIFDQQYSAEVTRGANFGLTLRIDDISSTALEKWLQLGSKCKEHKDDCLAQAQSENLDRLPWQFSYEIIASDSSNKITKPASEQTRQAILERLNWAETSRQLNSL